MGKGKLKTAICTICGQSRLAGELLPGEMVREPIASELRRDHPDWNADQPVCFVCLNRYRAEHVRRLLEEEKGELSALDEEVIESLAQQELISENINQQFERELTLGERLSDKLADFGGSWSFITLFALAMGGWIVLNSMLWTARPFDPFPFILLNLVLSCLAAIQAPIIMMSQNRQEAKDRLRSEYDYRVNLKAELEVRLLNAKMDQLLTHQWQRLLEIQQLQIDVMEDLAEQNAQRGRPASRETK